MSAKDAIDTLALIGGVVTFAVALYQYHIAQRWKRIEWVANEMRAFLNEPWVRVACSLIDWGTREVHLPPNSDYKVLVTDGEICVALVCHLERGDKGFTAKEALIRDTFDHFLDGLERCAAHLRSRLVHETDLAPYLSYWAFHIQTAQPQAKVDRLVQLKEYARNYGYSGALQLIQQLSVHHKNG